jgi:UDP-3-O-[3-hydroxymyristoyl] glucosamine N-acyltransferase
VYNINKKNLYIFGCSGIAKSMIDSIIRLKQYDIGNITMIDKDVSLSGVEFYRKVPCISEDEFRNIQNKCGDYICAFYKPFDIFDRLEYAKSIESRYGLTPINVIDCTVNLSSTAKIGRGIYLAPGVIVDSDAQIGDHSIILFNSIISRECNIHENNFISGSVVVKGSVIVKSNNFISSNCVIVKDVGQNNFINSGIVLNRKDCERMIIAGKNVFIEVGLPASESAAKKKLRYMNP